MKILGDGKVNIQTDSLNNILKQENKSLWDWPKSLRNKKLIEDLIGATGMT